MNRRVVLIIALTLVALAAIFFLFLLYRQNRTLSCPATVDCMPNTGEGSSGGCKIPPGCEGTSGIVY